MPSWPADPDGHLAEEARLAFVAMTRAKRVYLTYADAYLRQAGPSVFLGVAALDAEMKELTRATTRLEPEDVLLTRKPEVHIAAHHESITPAIAARVGARRLDD